MDKKAIVEKLNVRNYYVSELPSLKANGSKAMALCPFHDDTNPSLSIDLGTGRFNCFGCGRQGSIIDFYITKHGVSFNEAKKILIEQGILLTPQKVITQTYNYVDESGTLLFQVVRYSPKEFRQRRPDGEGGWFWNLKDTRKILYNLPEVIKTKSVVICEGEKDVEFLKNLGLPATCNPMGAGKWRDEYNDHFIDKYVAVVMDCDPPGRDHGEKVARSVHSCAKSVKLIDLGKLPYIKFSNEAWNSGEDLEDFWKAFVAYHGKENLKLFRKLILTIIASTTPYCPSVE